MESAQSASSPATQNEVSPQTPQNQVPPRSFDGGFQYPAPPPPPLDASSPTTTSGAAVAESRPQSPASDVASAINTTGEQVPSSPGLLSIPMETIQPGQQQQEEAVKPQEIGPNVGDVKKNAFYSKTIKIVYRSISNEQADPEKPFCKLDCGFQAIDCIGCTCKRSDMPFEKINNMTPILRRARSKGWLIHSQLAFPLTNTFGRTVWVSAELLMVFAVLGLSIARFLCGKTEIFNILHLALSIFASFLGIFDVFVLFCGCPFIRCGAACMHTEQLDINSGETEQLDINSGESSTRGKCQECCLNATRNAFDVGRMIMSELIFYPLLICAMFEVITSEAYFLETNVDYINCALFVTSAILMLAFVYIVRITVSSVAISNLKNKRFPPKGQNMSQDINTSNAKSAKRLQVYFILHALGQIVVQVVMLMSIAETIYHENNFLLEDCAVEEPFPINGQLWYMLVAGYIAPILGLFSFYLVTFYWFQEFPIGICIDFIEALNNNTLMERGLREKISAISNHLHFSQLIQEFEEIKTSCCLKFLYPFQSPFAVIFSFILLFVHAVFIIIAFISIDSSLSWTFWFLVSTACVIYIMNLYAFSIVFVWWVILNMATVAAAVVFAVVGTVVGLIFIALLLLCVCLFSSSDTVRTKN